jgi:predicted negative regulator of RcsB-dependent stress response
MAELPHPDAVRVLLTDPKVPPGDLDRYGDAFLDAGRASVATMFYERSKNADRAKKIADRAVKDGDAFLMEWVARIAPAEATPESWERVGDAALQQGKLTFAKVAFEKAGRDAKAAEATTALLKMLNA